MIPYCTESCFPGVLFELCRNPNLEKFEPPVVLLRKQSLSFRNAEISISAEFINSFTPEAACRPRGP